MNCIAPYCKKFVINDDFSIIYAHHMHIQSYIGYLLSFLHVVSLICTNYIFITTKYDLLIKKIIDHSLSSKFWKGHKYEPLATDYIHIYGDITFLYSYLLFNAIIQNDPSFLKLEDTYELAKHLSQFQSNKLLIRKVILAMANTIRVFCLHNKYKQQLVLSNLKVNPLYHLIITIFTSTKIVHLNIISFINFIKQFTRCIIEICDKDAQVIAIVKSATFYILIDLLKQAEYLHIHYDDLDDNPNNPNSFNKDKQKDDHPLFLNLRIASFAKFIDELLAIDIFLLNILTIKNKDQANEIQIDHQMIQLLIQLPLFKHSSPYLSSLGINKK